MNKKLLASVVVCASLVAFGEATYTEEGGYYVFNLSSDDTFSKVLSGANGVRKLGVGKLTFTAANTYTGELIVEMGTVAATAPKNFGKMTKITVEEGATLDFSAASSDASIQFLSGADVTISGKGVNDQGALKRTTGGAINNVFKSVTLAADATINIGARWGFSGNLNLKGHKLTRIGNAHGILVNTTVYPDDGDAKGSIATSAGDLNLQASTPFNGSEENILSITGGRLMLYQATGLKPWTVEIGGTVNFDGAGANTGKDNPAYNIWSGPVWVKSGNTCTFRAEEGKGLRLAGPVTVDGTMAFSGVGYYEFSGGLTNKSAGINTPLSSDVEFAGGRHLISGDSIIVGALVYRDGTHMEMSKGCHHYVGSSDAAAPASLTVSGVGTTLAGYPNGICRLRPGQYNGSRTVGYGFVRVGEGALVTDYTVDLGWATNGVSAFYLNGGEVRRQDTQVIGEGGYGYMGMSGGSYTAVGTNDERKKTDVGRCGFGAFHQSGGVYAGGNLTVAKDAGSGEVYLSGGTNKTSVVLLQGTTSGVSVESAGTALLALSGSNTVLDADHAFTKVERQMASTSILAVNDGASLKTGRLILSPEARAAGAELHVGFDGGIVYPMLLADFFNTSNYTTLPTSFVVYDGGMTVDTTYTSDYEGNLGASIFCSEIKKPTGLSVKTISLPTSDAYLAQAGKYLGAPKVTIIGKGKAAAAVAIFDDASRTVTGIKVVSPGFDYDGATTATIASWDGKAEYACDIAVEAQKGTGGIRKRGKQNLYINCSADLGLQNTFGGFVEALEGGISFNDNAASFPEGIGLIVHPGATIGLGRPRTVRFVNGAGTVEGGSLTVTDSMCLASSGVEVKSNVTLRDGLKLSLDPTTPLAEDAEPVTLLKTTGLTCDLGQISVSGLPANWKLVRRGNNLVAKQNSGLILIVQ